MKKPKYQVTIFAVVFLALFIAFGVLGSVFYFIFPDIPTKDGGRTAEIGLIFMMFSFTQVLGAVPAAYIAYSKNKKHKEILSKAYSIKGTVVDVEYMKTIRWGGEHDRPYRIKYKYSYKGEEYYAESILYWERPPFYEKDEIEVFINLEDPSESSLKENFDSYL